MGRSRTPVSAGLGRNQGTTDPLTRACPSITSFPAHYRMALDGECHVVTRWDRLGSSAGIARRLEPNRPESPKRKNLDLGRNLGRSLPSLGRR